MTRHHVPLPALLLALATVLRGLTACGPEASSTGGGDGGPFGPDVVAAAPPDAALWAPDAAAEPGADAFFDPGDAGAADAEPAPGPDAELRDAALPLPSDAGPPGPDASTGGHDASTVGPDASTVGPDASTVGPDASTVGPDASTVGPDAGAAGAVPVRVMAANLTAGPLPNYDTGEGLRLIEGVSPDVVLIQEFHYGDDTQATVQAMVDSTLGAGFSWCREYATPPPAGSLPNGVVSRWPILECGSWDDTTMFGSRDFAYARIDLPGPRDLWAVSVHLRTSDAATRDDEARVLAGYLQGQVPPGDLLVVGGDFNTDTRAEACFATLSAVLNVAAPHPADQRGNTNTNRKRQLPFDHVLAGPGLRALQVPTVVGQSVYPAGLVLDSRVYTPLQEIAPALEDDSAAPNMQHMGVVKDFLVPY